MARVTTRRATLADLAELAPLFDQYRQFYERPSDPALAARFLGERLRNDESVVFLATDGDGRAVAFCQLYPSFCSVRAARTFILYDLFVSPAARRLGAGRALLLAAEAFATAEGAARMELSTARTNRAAQGLYEAMGWERDDVFLVYTRTLVGAAKSET